jgi:hypothetical protein
VSENNKKVPTHEEIEVRAYQIYLKRRDGSSGELDDWLAAEAELSGSRQADVQEPAIPDVTAPLRKRAIAS